MNEVFIALMKDSRYAIESASRDLVYQTYGAACMAYNLGAITYKQYEELNTILVKDGLNASPQFLK